MACIGLVIHVHNVYLGKPVSYISKFNLYIQYRNPGFVLHERVSYRISQLAFEPAVYVPEKILLQPRAKIRLHYTFAHIGLQDNVDVIIHIIFIPAGNQAVVAHSKGYRKRPART